MSKKTLIKNENGGYQWVAVDDIVRHKEAREDLTVDGYIKKHGGILSHADNKVYTTKSSYMDSLKAQGLTIKDW